MTSNIFTKTFVKNNNAEKYDKTFVDYLIDSFLKQKSNATIYEVNEYLVSIYNNNEKIVNNNLKKELQKRNRLKYGRFVPNPNNIDDDLEFKFSTIKLDLSYNLESRENAIENLFNLMNKEDSFRIISSIVYLNNIDDIDYLNLKAKIFLTLKNENILRRKTKKLISNIDPIYLDYSLEKIFNLTANDRLMQIFNLFNIKNLKDLFKMNNDFIFVFFYDLDFIFNVLERLNSSPVENLNNFIKSIYDSFSFDFIQVFIERSLSNPNKRTLEQIAIEQGITRERVRQKENKVNSNIKKITIDNIEVIKIFITFCFIYYNQKEFLKFSDIGKIIDNENNSLIFTAILNLLDTRFIVDNYYQIIYDRNTFSIDLYEQIYLNDFSFVITNSQYNNVGYFHQKIINKFYSFKDNKNIWMKKGTNLKQIIYEIIKTDFPDGYHISDKSNYEHMINKLNYIFDGEIQIAKTIHRLLAVIDRTDAILIDKGTYSAKENVIDLSEELSNKIIDFLTKNKNSQIYYSTIYETFKNELNNIGINNYYYLKGLLDKKLPSDFKTKRNYIIISDNGLTARQMIESWILNQNGIFTIDDFKKSFPGLKEYSFYQIIYDFEINNKLLFLSDKKFKILNNEDLPSKENENKLKNIIENELDNEENLIKAANIYITIFFEYKDLLNDLKIVKNSSDLFSYLKIIFQNKFYFQRPFIAKEKKYLTTQNDLFKRHFSEKNKFNWKDVSDFKTEFNLQLYSYLDFMNIMSEEFVQVSVDEMINKKVINLPNNFLDSLTKILNYFLDNGSLLTEFFDKYDSLPTIPGLKWNEYLLTGIIRTYLPNNYVVKNTARMYNDTHYEIKKNKG